MKNIIETLKSTDNEATRAPYWLILDPRQNMNCDVHVLAGQISGPFFSRADAQKHLNGTRYNFSRRAVVYCCSGHQSRKYEALCDSLDV